MKSIESIFVLHNLAVSQGENPDIDTRDPRRLKEGTPKKVRYEWHRKVIAMSCHLECKAHRLVDLDDLRNGYHCIREEISLGIFIQHIKSKRSANYHDEEYLKYIIRSCYLSSLDVKMFVITHHYKLILPQILGISKRNKVTPLIRPNPLQSVPVTQHP